MRDQPYKISPEILRQRQNYPLVVKEGYTAKRIKEWYDHYNGMVYVAFSGGKDSTVLLHQVRKLYPDVPAVFADTGLEYPEIKEFVRSIPNVEIVRPVMSFKDVIEKYGYPAVSKNVARFVRDCRKQGNNAATKNLRMTGYNRKGEYCPSMKLSKKWHKLIDAPFNVSEQCCQIMKKDPLGKYAQDSGRYPMSAVMACESRMRERMYLRDGCAPHDQAHPVGMPMAFWTDKDIWDYIHKYDVPYSKIYDMGEARTGCIFCMFGVHLEKGANRFQRMKTSHPKLYDYCINVLGCGKVLDYIGVKYT